MALLLLVSRNTSLRHYVATLNNSITAKRTFMRHHHYASRLQQHAITFASNQSLGTKKDGGVQHRRTITTSPTLPSVLDSVRSTPPPTKKEKRRRGDDDITLNLKKLTNEALSANHVIGSWTLQNISMIRACMEQWLLRRIRGPINHGATVEEERMRTMRAARERAVWSTKILCRWVDELATGKNALVSAPELVQVLHRVLHAWRLFQQQLHQQQHQQNHSIQDHFHMDHRAEPCRRALALLQIFRDLVRKTSVNESSNHLWWPSDKAYAMVFEILALHPEHAETMNMAESLLNERLGFAHEVGSRRAVPLPDLVVWNACLHVLAKCSPYTENAPERVETLFRRITALPENNRGGGDDGGGGLPRADEKSYAARLQAWAKSGRPQAGERAQAILDEMIYKDRVYNRVCFNLCITAWARSGQPERAEKVLWSMMEVHHDACNQNKESSVNNEMRPDHGSFMAVINAWRLSKDPRSAERVEHLMSCLQNLYNDSIPESGRPNSSLLNEDDGDLQLLLPTTTSMNAVLDTWAGKRNAGPKVEALLRRMITAASKDPSIHPPSLETYTIAIKAWALTTDVVAEEAPERAEALLQELEDLSQAGQDDLTPNVIAYTATIQAWANSRLPDAPMRALSLLRHMQYMSRRGGGSDGPRQERAAPNLHTYNTVLFALAQHGLALDAERLFDEMKDDASVFPNSMSYTNLIHAHAKTGLSNSPDRCRELLLEMEMGIDEGNARIKPTPTTYSAVIKACGSHSGDDAEAILWRMQERFINSMDKVCSPPTTHVCNSVLRVWANSREGMAPQRAESILRWMQEQYAKGINDSVQPDKTSFDLVIKTWARSRRRRADQHVDRLLEEMKSQERRISPDS